MSSDRVSAPQQDALLDRVFDAAVRVRNLSKVYRIYDRPQDRLKLMLFARLGRNYGREFWALRDISFDLKKGECLGIIGRNGSGKSTLLQIIAGTVSPTTGKVWTSGRVSALLELGSGFNPEFTGRENVLMNGAILGISRDEMVERLEDIAAFADIGQFFDQPVKLFSSGMVVRLAFAVQMCVSKDVLIVDEALAVGDEGFQRKCLRAMEDLQEGGCSIILVSHDSQTVVRRCKRTILLNAGEILAMDESKRVVDLYQRILYSTPATRESLIEMVRSKRHQYGLLEGAQKIGDGPTESPTHFKVSLERENDRTISYFDGALVQPIEKTYGNGKAEILDCWMLDVKGDRVNVLTVGEEYCWRYCVRFFDRVEEVGFGMNIKTVDGIEVAPAANLYMGEKNRVPFIEANSYVEVLFALRMNLAPGTYFMNAGVSAMEGNEFTYLHRRVDVASIRVVPRDTRQISGIAFLDPQFSYRRLFDYRQNRQI
jgi:lipopolysaccharide transport system ATP-binding protein